jgi:hypothetical protein
MPTLISFRLFDRQITIDIQKWNDESAMRREWNKNGVWVTAKGKKIPVEKMTTSHLMNVCKMLEDKAEWYSKSVWSMPLPQGDMAQLAYYEECDYEDLHGKPTKEQVLESFAIYPHLVAEFKRRGI